METYIVNDCLHVTLSQDENCALICANLPGLDEANRTAKGNQILALVLEAVERSHAATGRRPLVRVKVEDRNARNGYLAEQRERWAQQAAATTPFPLETCRLVADFAEDQSQADGILEMAGLSGRSPQSIMKALKERREA